MLCLYRWEMKQYACRLSTYVYWFLATLATGLLSALFGFVMGYPNASYGLVYLLPVAMLLLPIPLLIRANGRKEGESQLLLSLPVSPLAIALSQMLSVGTVALLPYFPLLLLPPVLSFFGTVDFAASYVSLLGFFLFLGFLAALSAVLLRLCSSKRMRLLGAYGAVVLIYGINILFSYLPVGDALGALNPVGQFYAFTYGDFPIGATVFFLLLFSLLAFSFVLLCKGERGDLRVRGRKRSAVIALALLLVLCLGGTLVLPLLVEEQTLNPKVSASEVYEISGVSQDFLATLDSDVELYYVCRGERDRNLYRFVKEYASLSSHLSLDLLDPNGEGEPAALCRSKEVSEHSLLLVAGDRYLILDAADLFHYYNKELELSLSAYQYEYYRAAYAYYARNGSVGDYDITAVEYGARLAASSATVVYFDGDGLLTNGVAYVSDGTLPTVTVLEKGKDVALDPVLESYMIQSGYFLQHTSSLSSLQGVDLLLLCLTEDLTAEEAKALGTYLENGGRTLLLTSFDAVELPNLYGVTRAYGLGVRQEENVVCSQNEDAYYSADRTSYFLTNIAPCEATGDFNGYFVSILAHAIEITETEGVTVTPWLSTDGEGYLLLSEGEELTDDGGERLLGKYHVGVISEKGDGTLIWISSLLSASYAGNSMSGGGNFELLLSAMDLYTQNRYQSMEVPSRQATEDLLSLSAEQMLLGSLLLLIPLPAMILGGGIVKIRRRKRR